MTAPALYPTPTRIDLAETIRRGEVRWYAFRTPEARWTTLGRDWKVTSKVSEFVRAGLVQLPPIDPGKYGRPTLTAAGEAWLAEATKDSAR